MQCAVLEAIGYFGCFARVCVNCSLFFCRIFQNLQAVRSELAGNVLHGVVKSL